MKFWTFPSPHIYALQATDSDWTKSQTRTGRGLDELSMFPRGAYSTIDLGGDEKSCMPGPNLGVPSTKIPIIGTTSTVIQFAEETEASKTEASKTYSTNDGAEKGNGSKEGNTIPTKPGPGPPVTTTEAVITQSREGPGNGQASIIAVIVVDGGESPTAKPLAVSHSKNPELAPAPTHPALPKGLSALPSSAGVVLQDGATLKPGSATIMEGTTLSLPLSATALVVDGTTIPLTPNTNLNMETWTMLLGTAGVILPNGETLRPGMATSFSSTVVSFDKERTMLVVGAGTSARTVLLENIASATGGTTGTEILTLEAVASETSSPSGGNTSKSVSSGSRKGSDCTTLSLVVMMVVGVLLN